MKCLGLFRRDGSYSRGDELQMTVLLWVHQVLSPRKTRHDTWDGLLCELAFGLQLAVELSGPIRLVHNSMNVPHDILELRL